MKNEIRIRLSELHWVPFNQSQRAQNGQQNSKEERVSSLKRRKTRATKLRSVLVLFLIG